MPLPSPESGMVLRYDYLWSRELEEGRQHGKDRPACLVVAGDSATKPRHVVLLPITHSPPNGESVGVEIPHRVKLALGLDDLPSWVIISEYNVDQWPNSGLSQVPGRPGEFSYGFLPPALFGTVKRAFLDLIRQKRATSVKR